MIGGDPDRNDILAAERAINEQYRTKLDRDLSAMADNIARITSLSRSAVWTNGAPRAAKANGIIHPVIGRVAIAEGVSPVDGELYIGPQISELDGEITVVSWAAPVAQLFFEGRRSQDPAASGVLGRRTFTTKGTDLADFVDDLEPDVGGRTVFAIGRSASIEVPAAPKPVERPRSKPVEAPGEARPGKPSETEGSTPVADDRSTGAPALASAEATNVQHRLRAAEAVLDIVQRPRTGQLTSVLATLQPDQYDLVTWPAERPLIVSGQPGSGKTVVAMHRAGFLTHPERPGGPIDRLVVVGPTDEYSEHVKHVSKAVGGADVPVRGLPSFLAKLAHVNVGNIEHGPRDRVGVQWNVWSVVHRAARAAGMAGRGQMADYRALVKALVTDTDVHRKCVEDPELSSWLKAIGSFEKAASHDNYLPFLASTAVAVFPLPDERVDHMIVDEAQDVPPLVWHLLLSFIHEGGSVSLFGDMNQRRSDWTADSWERLAVDLELTDDDGVVPLRHLQTGYRTTRQILKFANQLLPSADRANHGIRDGIAPEVRRVGAGQLIAEVLGSADSLSQRHPEGLTAVISRDPKPISDAFRNAGWSRGRTRDSWKSDERTILVLHPDRARGLEFDGVVVVEPSSFPQNVGRDGVLYTSLTHATKELSVLYSGAMPKNLRAPR